MKKSDALAALAVVIGLVVSYFLLGLVPALWILGALIICLFVYSFASSSAHIFGLTGIKIFYGLSIVLVIISLVVLFIRFGWAVALAFFMIVFVREVVHTITYKP